MISALLSLFQTSVELGLISSLTVLSLFVSYSMLDVCDLSTDGCFTLGATVGAVTALAGHPFLSIPAAMAAGVLSGFTTGFLQTYMGIESLLAGIIVNTALYSVNIFVMGEASILNLNKTTTVFTMMKDFLTGTAFYDYYKLIIILMAVAAALILICLFLSTKLGLSIRATGNNHDMVRASSINPVRMTLIGLMFSNAFTALSGCLLGEMQKSVNIDIGSGMVTMALASLLIGQTFMGRGKIPVRAVGAVIGAVIFRVIYAVALRFNMPAYMLKFVSAVIVVIAIAGPYLRSKYPDLKRRIALRKEGI